MLVLLGVCGAYLYRRALNQRLVDALGDLQHPEMVQALLEKGADPHTHGRRGSGVMTYATNVGSSTLVALALRCRVSPEERDGPAATTPLMDAVWLGKHRAARFLLELGGHVNARDSCGRTALGLLFEQQQTYLTDWGKNDLSPDYVRHLAEDYRTMLRLLIQHGARE